MGKFHLRVKKIFHLAVVLMNDSVSLIHHVVCLLTEKPQEDVAKVWTLSASDMLDDDVELVDDDALLDADDLKKPDPLSLRGMLLLYDDALLDADDLEKPDPLSLRGMLLLYNGALLDADDLKKPSRILYPCEVCYYSTMMLC
jgi:hypothetical protein